MNNKFALYIHIPFCISKCSYCDFCSFVPKNTQMQDYVEALINEIEQTSKIYAGQVASVYIGGGTPSVLPLGAITRIMSAVKSNFNLQPNISITIEANPNSFDILKAQEYASAGCNRLSLGLQSHKPEILKVLNRVHNLQDFKNAVNNAVKVGITNINADVMLGVPNQSLDDLSETLKVLVDLPISHISAYGLICEPNTPLTKQIECQQLTLPSEDDTVQMYDFAVEFLKKYGFNRYEISNFAKTGFKSVHNLNYWARGQYLGVGLASHSFMNGTHFQNTQNLKDYLANPTNSKIDIEKETIQTAKQETIMLALRTQKGLNINEYNKTFKTNFMQEFEEVLDKLLKNNLIEIINNHLIIKNLYISNAIIAEFF